MRYWIEDKLPAATLQAKNVQNFQVECYHFLSFEGGNENKFLAICIALC